MFNFCLLSKFDSQTENFYIHEYVDIYEGFRLFFLLYRKLFVGDFFSGVITLRQWPMKSQNSWQSCDVIGQCLKVMTPDKKGDQGIIFDISSSKFNVFWNYFRAAICRLISINKGNRPFKGYNLLLLLWNDLMLNYLANVFFQYLGDAIRHHRVEKTHWII